MGCSSSVLALLTGGELSEIAVVITLPATQIRLNGVHYARVPETVIAIIHLVVENLRLSSLSLWNQALIEDVKNILADFLELGLNLLTVIADSADVFVSAF